MTTIGRFIVEGFLETDFRDEVFDLRTAIGVIKVDIVSIRSSEMTDNMHRIDKFLGNSRDGIRIGTGRVERFGRIGRSRFNRLFNIELNLKLR